MNSTHREHFDFFKKQPRKYIFQKVSMIYKCHKEAMEPSCEYAVLKHKLLTSSSAQHNVLGELST